MRGTDFQPWEAVECTFEDQVRERDRGFERVPDRVSQQTAALQPPARLQFPGTGRMQKDQDAELLGFGPHRVEFRVGQLLPSDATADRQSAQPQSLDRVFELLSGELRMLKSGGRK